MLLTISCTISFMPNLNVGLVKNEPPSSLNFDPLTSNIAISLVILLFNNIAFQKFHCTPNLKPHKPTASHSLAVVSLENGRNSQAMPTCVSSFSTAFYLT
uniref:Uncharacterized protein n=1 Tax=Opuntia streptacantha TaxID=393608 RepID=A0A7C8YMA4_OPUST